MHYVIAIFETQIYPIKVVHLVSFPRRNSSAKCMLHMKVSSDKSQDTYDEFDQFDKILTT